MNLEQIKQQAESLYKQTDDAITKMWKERLKVILSELADMFAKYQKDDAQATWTEFNKYNRLQKELDRIQEMLKDDYKQIAKEIKQSQQNVYLQSYLASLYLYEMASDVLMQFTVPDVQTIKSAIEQPIEFIKLDETLEKHRAYVLSRIRSNITQSIISGSGYSKMAQQLSKDVGMSEVQSRRVARTEGGRAFSQAQLDSYDVAVKSKANIEKYWMATLDTRTRSSHQHLDGKTTDKNGNFHSGGCVGKGPGLFVGLDSAGENINCRCTLGFKVDGQMPETRRARNDDGKNYTIPNMTYDEWIKTKKPKPQPKKSDAEIFKEMSKKGFHKRKDGSWGY